MQLQTDHEDEDGLWPARYTFVMPRLLMSSIQPRTPSLSDIGRSLVYTLLLVGCDQQPEAKPKPVASVPAAPAPAPAPTTAKAPPPASPQLFDASMVDRAATVTGLRKVKLEVDSNGTPVHVSLYHQQAQAIPQAIRDQQTKHYPGSTAREYETEKTVAEGEVFEVEVETAEGEHCEYSAKADGTLVYTECQLPADKLPPPVANTVKTTLPSGKIEEAEVVRRVGGPETYEVEVVDGERKHKLRLTADGKINAHLLVLPAELVVPLSPVD